MKMRFAWRDKECIIDHVNHISYRWYRSIEPNFKVSSLYNSICQVYWIQLLQPNGKYDETTSETVSAALDIDTHILYIYCY